ncbi:TetR/AcrR family transcriptional regulator [Actinocrinis sp.]|uniref:TetR/AcrR family transcriptional regulator n=1 Tax=Actinocrinis sp. TaxID=1920516 RepID=UPI0032C24AA1
MSPRQADPDLGATLMEAAARLLTEEGPNALSTRRLAAAAGTSTMAVYTHFGGMDDLVRAMVHEGFRRLNERMIEVVQTADPVADVAALGIAYRDNALENRHLYSVMFGGSTLGGFALNEEDRQYGRYALEPVAHAVARCMETGRFWPGDPRAVANQMWVALHGLVTLELGDYLIAPYTAESLFGWQVRSLLIGAGDDVETATASMRAAKER